MITTKNKSGKKGPNIKVKGININNIDNKFIVVLFSVVIIF